MSQALIEQPQQLQWETYTRQEVADFLYISVAAIHQRIQRGFGAEENKRMRLADAAHHVCLHDLVQVGLPLEIAFEAAKKAAPAVASFAVKYCRETGFMNLNDNRFIVISNKKAFAVDSLAGFPEFAAKFFGHELYNRAPYIAFDCSIAARVMIAQLPRHPIKEKTHETS